MHARVVRFTDVSPERIDEIIARVEENDGPPEGVESTGMKLLYDADQSTALFIGFFHERDKPVRSAVRAFSTYRLSDAGLLIATFGVSAALGAVAYVVALLAVGLQPNERATAFRMAGKVVGKGRPSD